MARVSVVPNKLKEELEAVGKVYNSRSGVCVYPNAFSRLQTEIVKVCNVNKELEKENAELKNRHENVCKNLTDTHRNIREQLANAVLIIKNLLHLWEDVMTEDTVKAMIDEAKQFLKEADK